MEDFELGKQAENLMQVYCSILTARTSLMKLAEGTQEEVNPDLNTLKLKLEELIKNAKTFEQEIFLKLESVFIEKMKERGFEATEPTEAERREEEFEVIDPCLIAYQKEICECQSLEFNFIDKLNIKLNIRVFQRLPEEVEIIYSTNIDTKGDQMYLLENLDLCYLAKNGVEETTEKIFFHLSQLKLQLEKEREKVCQEIKYLKNCILEKIQREGFVCSKKEAIQGGIGIDNFHLNIDFKSLSSKYEQNKSLFKLKISINLINKKVELVCTRESKDGNYELYKKTFSSLVNAGKNLEQVFSLTKEWS